MELIEYIITDELPNHLKGATKAWDTTDKRFKIYLYEVFGTHPFEHIRIVPNDERFKVEWMEMQLIKDIVWGEEALAIEQFPPKSMMINNSNTRHLWMIKNIALPDLGSLTNHTRVNRRYDKTLIELEKEK